jgi:D-alanyl-lipoteichoic acid acyltransferase DltB (MBOAT superfamily)
MSAVRLRASFRWVHIVLSAVLGTFLYSPWGGEPIFSAVMQWFVFPAMALSGLWMWQGSRLMQRWRGRTLGTHT